MAIYGLKLEASRGDKLDGGRDVVGEVSRAPAGNLVLRVGKEASDGSWVQTGHIVLHPDEASAFLDECREKLSGGR